MAHRLAEFQAYREKMNKKILGSGHLGLKRFFNLDAAAYRASPVRPMAREGAVGDR